jgi:diguanylate cyclase (GGDEF)-like protein
MAPPKNKSRQELEDEVQGFCDLLSIAQEVVSSLQLPAVLQNILKSAMNVMDMPAGSIALCDEEAAAMTLVAHAGLSPQLAGEEHWRVKPGGLTHSILEKGELFIVEETVNASFFNNPLAIGEGIRSLIAVPLKIQNKMVGILYLDDFIPRTFPEKRLRLLTILASFATTSIENARLHERMSQLACTDGLTGLYNHRHFQQSLREQLARAKRYKKPVSLLMFDLDNFKQFNDTFGHPAGDKALTTVAGILRDVFRGGDLLFRYGGEEFAVLLPETAVEEAILAADRARVAVAELFPRLFHEIPTTLTISVGVATCPRDGQEAEALLKTSDALLYRAKREGKNKVYHQHI